MYSRIGKRLAIVLIALSLCYGCSLGSTGSGEIGIATPAGDFGLYNRSTSDSRVTVEVAEEILAGLVDLIKGDDEAEQTVE